MIFKQKMISETVPKEATAVAEVSINQPIKTAT